MEIVEPKNIDATKTIAPRWHKNTCSRILADGTRRVSHTRQIYYPKTNWPQLTDELRASVIEDYEYGLSKTKIMNKYKIGYVRLSNILAKK